MRNLLINFSIGDKCLDSIDGDVFLNSLSKYNNFKKAVFYNNVSKYNLNKLSNYFDILIPTNENLYTGYIAFYNWLINQRDNFDYVMNCDLRDVVLQKNPFDFLLEKPGYNMYYICEGMKISENDCNLWWENKFRNMLRSHNSQYDDNFVINGGIFMGKIENFIAHCMLMFTNTNRFSKDVVVVDQQVMSYLAQFIKNDPKIYLSHPNNDTFCATGEAIKRNNVQVKYDGNLVCNLKGDPYYIFHQWDRTEVVDKIRQRQTNSLSFSI